MDMEYIPKSRKSCIRVVSVNDKSVGTYFGGGLRRTFTPYINN